MKPTCLIVDDEPVARRGLAEDLAAIGLVVVTGAAGTIQDAEKALRENPPDLVFLDIELPGMNGLEFLEGLSVKPMVILVTAYPQHALKGFELGVIDYLVKPVSAVRLTAACRKAVDWHQSDAGRHLYVKVNGNFERVRVADILYIKAANNYVRVCLTDGRRLLIYQSLKGMEEHLPAEGFVRTHKSFLVAKRHIRRITADSIVGEKYVVPLSRRFRSRVLENVPLASNT